MAQIEYLECAQCGERCSAAEPRTLCPRDGGLLYVRYASDIVSRGANQDGLAADAKGIWRYRALLPDVPPVSLGEGCTPLLRARRLPQLLIKEEAVNPSGSWQARGISVSVAVAKSWRVERLAMASAGNSAGALAAYAAAAGIEAHIFMPRGASPSNRRQCIAYGARLTELDGGLEDCLHRVAEGKKRMGWLDLSSQQEPFRLEGDKTIGCEIAQQLQWKLPHAILGFAGGGRALLAAWKAFGEMEELGWIGKERPQMVAVEVDGRHASPQPSAIILEILRQSGGRALVVSEQEALAARDRWARVEGFWAAPAGAAALAAYSRLRGNGCFAEQDIVVLLNPASPLKYPEPTPEAGPGARPSRQIGGIIGPY